MVLHKQKGWQPSRWELPKGKFVNGAGRKVTPSMYDIIFHGLI